MCVCVCVCMCVYSVCMCVCVRVCACVYILYSILYRSTWSMSQYKIHCTLAHTNIHSLEAVSEERWTRTTHSPDFHAPNSRNHDMNCRGRRNAILVCCPGKNTCVCVCVRVCVVCVCMCVHVTEVLIHTRTSARCHDLQVL